MTAFEIRDANGTVAVAEVESMEYSSDLCGDRQIMYASKLTLAAGAQAFSAEQVARMEETRRSLRASEVDLGKLKVENTNLNGQLLKAQEKALRLAQKVDDLDEQNAGLNHLHRTNVIQGEDLARLDAEVGRLRAVIADLTVERNAAAEHQNATIADLTATLEQDRTGLRRTIDDMDDEREGLIADAKRDTDSLTAMVDTLNRRTVDLDRRNGALGTAIQTLERQVNELTRERDGLAERLTDVETLRAGGLRTIGVLREELGRTRSAATDNLDKADRKIEELEARITDQRRFLKGVRSRHAEAGELLARRTLDNRDLERLLRRAGELIKASAIMYTGNPAAPRIQQMLAWLEDADAYRNGERSAPEGSDQAETVLRRVLAVLVDIRLYWPQGLKGLGIPLRDQVEMVIDQVSGQLAKYSPHAGVTGERDDRPANTGYDVPSTRDWAARRAWENSLINGSMSTDLGGILSMDGKPIGRITNAHEGPDGIRVTASPIDPKTAHEAIQRVTGAAEQASAIDDREWRVGGSYDIHVYAVNPNGKDEPVATALKPSFARQIVEEHREAFGGH